MPKLRYFLAALLTLGAASLCAADTVSATNGTDSFIAGTTITRTLESEGDVFLAGRTVTAKGNAAGDAHVAGMDLDVEARSNADLYAMGFSVSVIGAVGEDLTAAGYTVRTAQSAVTEGNARLMGNTVTIDGPVKGALSVTGSEVILNAPITGDAWIVADDISFGPDARIAGMLRYAAPAPVTVPERVVAPAQITYEELRGPGTISKMREGWDRMEYPVLPTFLSMFSAFLLSLILFVIIGAIFLTFLPKPVNAMRRSVAARPGQIFLVGIVGLSMLFGAGPIIALTIVGIPLLPIVLLAIILAWMLGYMLGAYAVAQRVLEGFWGITDASKVTRLVAFAIAICVIAVLNFIPFVGWVANYTLVLLGIGAMTNALFERMIGNPGYAMDVDMKPNKEE